MSFQVLLLLILFVLRSRITLVVALFYEAGKCLTAVPLLLLQPLWTFLILFAFFVYWLVVLIHIATLGKNWIFSSAHATAVVIVFVCWSVTLVMHT